MGFYHEYYSLNSIGIEFLHKQEARGWRRKWFYKTLGTFFPAFTRNAYLQTYSFLLPNYFLRRFTFQGIQNKR